MSKNWGCGYPLVSDWFSRELLCAHLNLEAETNSVDMERINGKKLKMPHLSKTELANRSGFEIYFALLYVDVIFQWYFNGAFNHRDSHGMQCSREPELQGLNTGRCSKDIYLNMGHMFKEGLYALFQTNKNK